MKVFCPWISYLRLPQSVQVGDVKHAAHSSSVHAACPSLLQTQVAQNLAEAGILGGGEGRKVFNYHISLQEYFYGFTTNNI